LIKWWTEYLTHKLKNTIKTKQIRNGKLKLKKEILQKPTKHQTTIKTPKKRKEVSTWPMQPGDQRRR